MSIIMTTTPPPSAAIDIEWLTHNCYIKFAHEDQEYWNGDSHGEETNEDEDRIISYHICEVCRRSRPDWMRFQYEQRKEQTDDDDGYAAVLF